MSFTHTTASSSSSGFMASLNNLLQSILHIFASFARSGLAFLQFIFAILTDVINASWAVLRRVIGTTFNITKGATAASYKVTKGTVNTGAHATAGVTRGVFGFMEGIVGFVVGNFVAISLCIAVYYVYTSYQRQTRDSRNTDADTATLAKATLADAASRAQKDASQTWNKANEKVKGSVDAGATRVDAAYERAKKNSTVKN